jgi:gluconate 2-dehydrogenase alpha chain
MFLSSKSRVHRFLEKPLNRFMGSGAAAIRIADLDGDVFDHTEVSFLRGGIFRGASPGYRPIESLGVVPQSVRAEWGSDLKKVGALLL